MIFLLGFFFCWSTGEVRSFLGSLHWPRGGGDLGVGGISYLEFLFLY